MKSEATYQVTIFIGGDLAAARAVLRAFCYEHGQCFSLTPSEFIYTGGEEQGMAIGLVNYPRFPTTPASLDVLAVELAELLLPALNQRSCLLVGTVETSWLTIEPPGTSR